VRNNDRLAILDVGNFAPVILTRAGKRLLIERASALRGDVLPELRAALADPERDSRVDAEFERAVNELRHLVWLVEHATLAEDLSGEPTVVELGRTVTVRDDRGVVERFLIVHPLEAPLDDLRISVSSPLAQALLGHRVGEEVEVAAPSGRYRCWILAVEGPPIGPDATAAERRRGSVRPRQPSGRRFR
jgi:transcription elongation factor GreA